jgi:hypothetical protein
MTSLHGTETSSDSDAAHQFSSLLALAQVLHVTAQENFPDPEQILQCAWHQVGSPLFPQRGHVSGIRPESAEARSVGAAGYPRMAQRVFLGPVMGIGSA